MNTSHSPKITVIGGGSIMWTPSLLNDITLFDSLKESIARGDTAKPRRVRVFNY